MRVLIDTNVLLRIADDSHVFHRTAADAVRLLGTQGHKLFIVPQVINSRRLLQPILGRWLDSSEVLAITEQQNAREQWNANLNWTVKLMMRAESSGQTNWQIDYHATEGRQRFSRQYYVHAETGEVISCQGDIC